MNVLLLNPPFVGKFSREQRSPAVTKSGTLYYPMWLSLAAGCLMKDGVEVLLLDAPADGLGVEEVARRAQEFGPQMLVLSTSTPSIHNDVAVGGQLKDLLPDALLVLVGPHVSALPRETLALDPRIDAIARGEYDYTLRELARKLAADESWRQVQGLVFRREADTEAPQDEMQETPSRPPIRQLDDLPFAASVYKQFLTIENYFYAITRHPVVAIITARGCPHRCTYCVYPQTFQGHKFRSRSPENIAEEFEYIRTELRQVREVFLEDDTFTINVERCRAVCELLIKKRLKLTWTANARCDVDLDTLKLMKAAGCRLLCVGVESGSQQILDNIKKGITLERIRAFVRDAKKARILVHACMIVGNAGETPETLQQTLDFAKELSPDTAQFFPLMVYPGTEAYEVAKRENWLSTEDFSQWVTDDGLHYCVVSRPGLTNEDLVNFCDRARREFYLRPSYILSKARQCLTSFSEARRTLKSFRTFARYLWGGTFGNVKRAEKACN